MLDIKLKLKPGHTGERAWMEPSPLRTLFWNVTYACNYGCPICFTDGGSAHPDELTTGEALEAVQKASEAGVGDILISGGEPFQRKDLLEELRTEMRNASKDLEFERAAELRDEIARLEKMIG